ncbi:uncharacterized protein LOC128721616 [Anopheles nili]|uniref:uncharacterized protein LOC128721616 n=1 Tax=Anopheles nili TaxID=185578 RepID=UPI00237AE054|nr:uncharacterized protein LOC128721616 [Anopheles nili]
MMADSPASNTGPAMAGVPAGTVGGGGGGPHDPTVIPQWKKELIQRRKNLAKTIGAVATQVHDSASTVAAAISASASSPVTAHPRTPTGSGAFPVGSPFYAGSGTKDTTTCAQADATTVTASETLHQLSGGAEQPVAAESSGQLAENSGNNNDFTSCSISDHATVTTTASPTSPGGAFAGVHYGAANEHLQQQQHYHHSQQHHHQQQQQQQQRGGVGSATRGPAEAVAVLVPPSTAPASGSSPSSLPTANGAHSHSNATTQHSSEQSGSSAAIGSATQHRTTGGTVIVERESSSVCSSAAVVGGKVVSGTHSPTQQQQQQQQQHTSRDGVAARKMVAATAAEEIVVVYEKSSVLGGLDVTGGGGGGIVGGGGVGGGGGGGIGDAGEELKYGPGIVSRLRCRYLSLALRQSVAKQRPSLNSMRRATSLNNLLDEESEDLSEREQSIGSEGTGGGGVGQQQKKYQSQNYHHQHQHHQQQQQQYHREHYTNGNGNNHNHNHNHHQQQQQQQIHPTVVLQAPPYLKQQQQQHQFAPKQQPWVQQQHQQQLQHQEEQQPGGGAVKTAPFLRGVQNSYTRASRQVEKKNEYNRYTKHHRGAGGADAILLKRARSVEALVRYDHKAWERDAANPVASAATTATTAPPAPVAVAPATVATVPSTTITTVSSSVEVGSNVIILDEIAQPTTATTTTTVTATPPAAVAAAVVTAHLNEGHVTSNGISSSNLITTTGSPTASTATATATTTTTAAMLLNGKGATGAGGAPDLPLLVSDCVTIEEKIINGREKGDPKPKRLTSFIDADERPPPDVVKQTMKIFEANANRRGGRPTAGTGGGVVTSVATTAVAAGSEVAHKVASYRSIIISGTVTTPPGVTTTAAAAAAIAGEKPPITHPKPPLSPKKPNIKPRTASPKQQQQVVSAAAGKPPPTPKTLEAVNNLKNVALTPSSSSSPPPVVAVKNHNKPPTVGMTEAPKQQQQQHQQQATPPSPPARSKHTTPVVANGANGGSGVGTKGPQSDALKNGATIRDHNNYENGTTQTPSTGAKTLSSTTTATTLATPGSDHQHMHTSGTGNTAREAATSPTTTTTTGICDSPSIQQLTGKLASLHLATSTPTGAANGSVLVQDRRNLDYVTSEEDDTTTAEEEEEEDEEQEVRDKVDHGKAGGITGASGSYTVNPDSSEEGEDVPAVGGGSEHDADGEDEVSPDSSEEEEEEENEEHRSVRKISRTAMENIARAGTTTQFRFNGAVKSSYLPGASGAGGGGMTPVASNKPPAPPIPMSRESLTGGGVGKPPQIEANGRLPPEGASVVTSSNSNGVSSGSSSALSAASVASGGSSAIVPGGALIPTAVPVPVPSLTRREIEKNQINREKSGESVAVPVSSGTNNANGAGSGVQVASANNGSGGGANGAGVKPTMAPTTAIDSTTSFVAKWGTGGSAGTVVSGQSPLAGLVPVRKKTKPPPSHQQDGTNTMVFNFSDRKDVPDYIENDGVIIRPRPRELPKPGESGFVVLGDLTLETSTDPDDAWATGPPSPCNGEFANAYIVINGKSSMRNKTSRSSKFKIQFDDSLTSTYEYPSETSLLEANGYDDADTGTDANGAAGLAFVDNGLLSHTNKLLSSVPLGSAPFASYTPVKAAIDTTFELGVTRTPSPSAASTASSTGSNGSLTTSSNSSNHSQHSATSATSTHSEQKAQLQHSTVSSNGHHHHQLQQHQLDRPNNNGLHSNGHSNGDAMLNGEPLLGSSGTGEPESIQYLKPASDEQTVNWSQGTRVTDLLF